MRIFHRVYESDAVCLCVSKCDDELSQKRICFCRVCRGLSESNIFQLDTESNCISPGRRSSVQLMDAGRWSFGIPATSLVHCVRDAFYWIYVWFYVKLDLRENKNKLNEKRRECGENIGKKEKKWK